MKKKNAIVLSVMLFLGLILVMGCQEPTVIPMDTVSDEVSPGEYLSIELPVDADSVNVYSTFTREGRIYDIDQYPELFGNIQPLGTVLAENDEFDTPSTWQAFADDTYLYYLDDDNGLFYKISKEDGTESQVAGIDYSVDFSSDINDCYALLLSDGKFILAYIVEGGGIADDVLHYDLYNADMTLHTAGTLTGHDLMDFVMIEDASGNVVILLCDEDNEAYDMAKISIADFTNPVITPDVLTIGVDESFNSSNFIMPLDNDGILLIDQLDDDDIMRSTILDSTYTQVSQTVFEDEQFGYGDNSYWIQTQNGNLFLAYEKNSPDQLNYVVFDSEGKLLLNGNLTENEVPGYYMMLVEVEEFVLALWGDYQSTAGCATILDSESGMKIIPDIAFGSATIEELADGAREWNRGYHTLDENNAVTLFVENYDGDLMRNDYYLNFLDCFQEGDDEIRIKNYAGETLTITSSYWY